MNKMQTILLIDDTPENLKVLGDMLDQAGYEILIANSGSLALEIIKDLPPDLVLLDIMMPEMDGYEVCRRMKADPDISMIPVIFISSLDMPEQKVLAFREGAADYITKPFQVEEVMARVETHLRLAQIEVLKQEIADRKRAEDELRQSEYRYRTLVNTIPDLVWLKDSHGVYLSCNKIFERFFGATEADIIGKTDYDFVEKETADLFRANDSKVMEAREVRTNEEWITFSEGGQRVFLQTTKVPMYDAGGEFIGVLGVGCDITARKLAEDALIKLSQAVKQSPTAIVITDLNGDIEYVNPAFCVMTGYAEDEVTGRNSRILKSGKTSLEQYRQLWETITAGKSWTGEFCNKKKNGELYWERACIAPIIDTDGSINNFVAVKEDATEQKRMEDALRESEKRLHTLIDEAPIGIALVRGSHFLYVNPSQARLFGFDRPVELIGTPYLERVAPEFQAKFLTYARQFANGEIESVQIEAVGIRKGGERFPGFCSVSILKLADGDALLSFVIDTSDLERSRKLMFQSEKMMMIGGLAAGVAHEINNPLSTIIQGIQNVKRRFSSELRLNESVADEIGLDLHKVQLYMEQRNIDNYFASMVKAADRASYIAANLLQFSRQGEVLHQSGNLNDIVDQSLDLAATDVGLRKKYNFKGICITKEYDKTLPDISMSITEIEIVIINILKNAAQALFDAGTEKPAITLRTFRSGEFAGVAIEDNGPGMSDEVRLKVFDPFFTTKGFGLGTGLGLSVSHSIITNKHGGTITVESQPGNGTRFTVQLPISAAGDES